MSYLTCRANLCANDVNAFLGYAVSAKYVEQHFDERAKAQVSLLKGNSFAQTFIVSKMQVLQMIKNTKAVFKDVITTLNWMDDEAKKVAIEKVDAMVELVGYPDWIKDKAALESHYSGVLCNTILERQWGSLMIFHFLADSCSNGTFRKLNERQCTAYPARASWITKDARSNEVY